jgi:hypothetical protein
MAGNTDRRAFLSGPRGAASLVSETHIFNPKPKSAPRSASLFYILNQERCKRNLEFPTNGGRLCQYGNRMQFHISKYYFFSLNSIPELVKWSVFRGGNVAGSTSLPPRFLEMPSKSKDLSGSTFRSDEIKQGGLHEVA